MDFSFRFFQFKKPIAQKSRQFVAEYSQSVFRKFKPNLNSPL
jgi:hypothetical protein